MSHLDKFIQNKVRTLLTEQKANLIPIPRNSIEKYDKTNRHVVSTYNQYLSPVDPATSSLTPWPSDKPGIWKNLAAQRFLQSFPDRGNAAPIMPISYTEFDKVAPNAPEYIWNFGRDTYVISDAGKFYSPTSKITLYWKWLPSGAKKVVKLPTDPIGQVEQLGKRGTGAMELRAGASPSSPVIGWLYIETNGEPNIEYFQSGIEQDAKNYYRNREERVLDALNVLGYWPGYGDAIDFVAAMFHFNRFFKPDGNVWDAINGLTSLIAVFPVYGSIIKGILNKITKKYVKKKYRNIQALLEDMAKSENRLLSPEEEKAFYDFMKAATAGMVSFRSKYGAKLEKIGFQDVDEALKRLEQFLTETEYYYTQYVKTSSSNLANAIVKKEAAGFDRLWKLLYKYNPEPTDEGMTEAGKVVGKAIQSFGVELPSVKQMIINALRKMVSVGNWTKTMKMNQKVMVENIKNIFTKSMQEDPDRFVMFLMFASKNPSTKFVGIFANRLKLVPNNLKSIEDAMLKNFRDRVPTINVPMKVKGSGIYTDPVTGLITQKAPEIKLTSVSTKDASLEQINDWLSTKLESGGKTYVSNYKTDPVSIAEEIKKYVYDTMDDTKVNYKDVVKGLVESEIAHGNPVWKHILADPLNNARGIFPTSVKTFAKGLAANFLNYRKNIDSFYEGVHEVLQDIGVAEDDKIKTSLTYEMIKKTINLDSDTKATIKDVSVQAATYLNIIKKVGNIETNATPNYQFQSVDPDSTWRPASSYPKAVSSTTALTMPKTYKGGQGKANWTKRTQPVIKQGRA